MAKQKNESEINIGGIPLSVKPVVESFVKEVISALGDRLEALELTGSILTKDFSPSISDINSVVVLQEIDLSLLDGLATLGRRYRKKKVRAPLIMTREYIDRSLDVFPIEFLDMKLLHKVVYGSDVLSDLSVDKAMLRIQCEKDLKARLINLRQGYIVAIGLKNALAKLILDAYAGFFPIFRAMAYIKEDVEIPPIAKDDVLNEIERVYSTNMSCFREIMMIRVQKKLKMGSDTVSRLFQEVYLAVDKLAGEVDEIQL